MNAEQLHSISRELIALLENSRTNQLLAKLESSLRNVVSQPQQGQHQTEVQETREQLIGKLDESDFNSWASSRFQIAKKIGATEVFGFRLAERINETFRENAATPEVIRSDIESMQKEVEEFRKSLDRLVGSLTAFNIEFEELDAGEGEIGITIPRSNTDGLYDFAKDLRRIDFEIKTLSQLVHGSPDFIPIRTVSSSDFLVLLASLPEVVQFYSKIVTALRVGYEKTQELKEVLVKIKELGNSSEETIKSVERDVEHAMSNEISTLLAEIRPMYETASEKGLTDNGFEVSLESTVKGIASRIDRGYSFSFRIGPPTVEHPNEPTEEEQEKLEMASEVGSNNERLQKMKLIEPGEQVLPIKWQTPDPSN